MRLDRHVTWRGRDIAWTSFGSGPPVVFCHGTPWSSVLWRPFAEALSADHRVYLWDMPGYGASSKDPAHAVDLAVQGELFAALLHEWDVPGAHIVAHDIGGAVALRAALLHGARPASLCLVDIVALRPWGSPFFRLVHDHADVFTALPPAVHRGALEAYVRTASGRGVTDQQLELLCAPWSDEIGQAAFYRQIAQADEGHTAEIEHLLGALTVPVHIVWGADDTWIPVDRATRLQREIPHATLRIVPDAGHLIQLDAPVALADELRAWLTRVS